MATEKQVEELTELFAQARPAQKDTMQSNRSDSESAGMLGVLVYLYRKEGTVTAGMISRDMHITTGRVSVLIQKMSDKGMVRKKKSPEDARVTEIRLTDKGKRMVENVQKKRTEQMEELIDVIGMDQLKEYIRLSQEVWKILKPISLDE